MAGAKLIVIFPNPTDVKLFEKFYQQEHLPMMVEKLAGNMKVVTTKVISSSQGVPPFYRISEIHFPSMETLEACEGCEEMVANAIFISQGGLPIF